jgi:hypothetical protein
LCQTARDYALADPEQTETHPLLEQKQWNPAAFVDLCDAARSGNPSLEMLCRKIQLREWHLLFDYCYRRAVGE